MAYRALFCDSCCFASLIEAKELDAWTATLRPDTAADLIDIHLLQLRDIQEDTLRVKVVESAG